MRRNLASDGKAGILVLGAVLLFSVWCSRKIPSIPEMNSPEAQTYIKRCASCHALPHPARLDFVRWKHIIEVMKKRIEERGHPPLTEDEERMILEYLRKYARK